jgi:alkylhydroperoxidase family enzyme
MARVTVPPERDALVHVWTTYAPDLARPAGALSAAVYERSRLPLRELEAARITVARHNDCAVCLTWRSARDVPARGEAADAVPEDFYATVLSDPASPELSERERLAAEFAGRFVAEHVAMDDALWDRLHAAFSDDELVELGLCVAAWLGLGRFNQVFGLDGACRVP